MVSNKQWKTLLCTWVSIGPTSPSKQYLLSWNQLLIAFFNLMFSVERVRLCMFNRIPYLKLTRDSSRIGRVKTLLRLLLSRLFGNWSDNARRGSLPPMDQKMFFGPFIRKISKCELSNAVHVTQMHPRFDNTKNS